VCKAVFDGSQSNAGRLTSSLLARILPGAIRGESREGLN